MYSFKLNALFAEKDFSITLQYIGNLFFKLQEIIGVKHKDIYKATLIKIIQ